ncbi:transglutaminase family protein [Croceicoccus sp. YJ47]|uniref:transglutaminase family protein n=1 Tax=Croceicoccus sp. YJ47 TaxID=2798724 RepID=UPI0019235FED|nr:transglutaminase family protein [Croceicoccus sp. YJ47]QQN74365.1 transglutaminase family protein [Croceicoccus sp. YJ47]
MPTVSINHVTRYRYLRDVAFGEHRILVRPRESFDQRLLAAELTISPEPERLRWLQDVFGNAVAIATFAPSTRAETLEVRGFAEVEHIPTEPEAIAVEDYAATYPFTYSAADMPDLLRSIERQYPDPDRTIDGWAHGFLPCGRSRPTLELLTDMTETIKRDFSYSRREEKGIQTPLFTLSKGGGTCRDFAVLMMEGVRALGLAARFVSGYTYTPAGSGARIGGHSTHAWVRVFLPGSGWIEFDPTNAIIGNRGLIRVAVARDPQQARPLSGTWLGQKGSQIDMDVDVRIKHIGMDTEHPDFETTEQPTC